MMMSMNIIYRSSLKRLYCGAGCRTYHTSFIFRYADSAAAATTKSASAAAKEEPKAAAVADSSTKIVETIKAAQKSEIELRQIQLAEEKKKLIQLLNEAEKNTPAKKSAASNSPFLNYLSSYAKLMRLDKPIGTYLTYWPSAWAIIGAAAYQHALMPDFYLLALFALGAVSMRSAGCIINDILDRDFDKHVERTKNRPLASGQISLPAAVGLLGANLGVSLLVLMQLNFPTQLLGACALLPVAVYPMAKRFTDWPQAVLGIPINWGALLGWSAVLFSSTTSIQSPNLFQIVPALFLLAGCMSWTLHYDTIYAFQDREHDKKLGLKSTAIHLYNRRPKLWLTGFSSVFIANMAAFGLLTNQEPIYYISLGLAMAHLIKQIVFVDIDSAESCQKAFKSNQTIGILIALGLLGSLVAK